MTPSALDTEIERALLSLHTSLSAAATKQFDVGSYIAAFRESAREKARAVLDHLSQTPEFPSKRPAFVSIGGGDGEEIEFLLRNSNGSCGILIEMKEELARAAGERELPTGKLLRVLAQPAQSSVGQAIQIAAGWYRDGAADSIVVTCHAVLHELYDRGAQHFDAPGFFGRIFADPEVPVWFTYREPGAPEKWPETVLISADCRPTALLELARAIVARHPQFRNFSPQPDVLGEAVRVHRNLGMEILSKLFYLDDLHYELQERSTAVEHGTLRNALWLAMGQKARHEHRAEIKSFSAPTISFASKWKTLKIQVDGLRDDHSTEPLGIPESQTRAVAWRVPPQPESKMTAVLPPDMTLAREALEGSDESLLSPLLVSRARAWIESSSKLDGVELLKRVAGTSPAASLSSIWSRYLLALASLFAGDASETHLFELKKEAGEVGLLDLLRAEEMEFLRKNGDGDGALRIANALATDLSKSVTSTADLDLYVSGTAHFLLANFLRFGGRYDQALEFIDAAEKYFRPSIPSHATELAHCFYARQVCVAMTGVSNFSTPYPLAIETAQQFARSLIELSYSHAAWFLGDIEQAKDHSSKAAAGFAQIGSPGYAERAKSIHALLTIWSTLLSGGAPDYETLHGEARRGVKAMIDGGDWDYLANWFAGLRPSVAVGLLQLGSQFSKVFAKKHRLTLPRTLENARGPEWSWSPAASVDTLREADVVLRSRLGIPRERVIPLIPD